MIPAIPACLPWHAAYPAPRIVAASISCLDLLGWFKEGKKIGKDYILIDLRRTDFEVQNLYHARLSFLHPYA
jgi:arsenical-resistance protein 2